MTLEEIITVYENLKAEMKLDFMLEKLVTEENKVGIAARLALLQIGAYKKAQFKAQEELQDNGRLENRLEIYTKYNLWKEALQEMKAPESAEFIEAVLLNEIKMIDVRMHVEVLEKLQELQEKFKDLQNKCQHYNHQQDDLPPTENCGTIDCKLNNVYEDHVGG